MTVEGPPERRHALYEHGVQNPAFTLRFIDQVFKRRFGSVPTSLREDFCGTAVVARHFVASSVERVALGVDHCQETLQAGEARHAQLLDVDARRRLQLMQGDVREVQGDEPVDFVDVIVAENFSYSVFHDEETLLAYFAFAFSNLNDHGLLVLDVNAGHLVQQGPHTAVTTKLDDDRQPYTMHWVQESFDAITNRARFHLTFAQGEQTWPRAFSYDWRVWSIPELVQLLRRAGFVDVDVHTDAGGKRSGTYRVTTSHPAQDAFVALITAARSPATRL